MLPDTKYEEDKVNKANFLIQIANWRKKELKNIKEKLTKVKSQSFCIVLGAAQVMIFSHILRKHGRLHAAKYFEENQEASTLKV
jgi:hypothetical protein